MFEHPELGYFDEGLDLVEPKLYAAATRPFGRAQMLPPTAYRSKIFADLEDEKVWTRTWVCVGAQQQIPNAGDLLPFTVGTHGIHVQRGEDGALVGRFNKAQHGGCRAVPAQCRTGVKTKCSFTSCGHSRDRGVIHGAEVGEGSRLAGQYLGDRPERLHPVKVESWGPFIFVNLDDGSEALARQLRGVAKRIGLDADLMLASRTQSEHACNWKLAGRAFLENLALPLGAERGPNGDGKTTKPEKPAPAGKPSHTLLSRGLARDYAARFPSLPALAAPRRHRARLCWLFPNLLLVRMPDHLLSVILQPTATAMTLKRTSIFVARAADAKAIAADMAELAPLWADALGRCAAHGESRQHEFAVWGSPAARPHRAAKKLPRENSAFGYDFQKFLVTCILREHEYYWAAPLYSRPGR